MASASDTVRGQAARLLQQGRAAEACTVLEAALAAGPADPAAERLLVRCLAQAGDLNAALDRQLALVPHEVAQADAQGRADTLAAAQLAQLAMDYARAEALARALVERDSGDAEAAQLLSTLTLWSAGPEAARAALAGVAVAEAPPHMLAELLAFHDAAPADLFERAGTLADDTALPAQARADLLFALAQHHDRAGEADRAWETAARANALAPARPLHDWREVLGAHLQIYRESAPAPEPSEEPRHLYLLGTARSGQSLLQSMLAAAPGVVSLGERGALLQHVLFRTADLVRMGPAARGTLFARLAESDRRGIARLAPAGTALVVDKSPLHLAVAGTVARIHPGAAFAAVVREPADTALSIWLRSFPPIYDFANDFAAVLDHIDFALDALAAWREAGLEIALFDHAALIADPSAQGGALFEHIGLAWDESYLAPENRTQPVPTFSAAQVRRPISPATSRNAAAYSAHLSPFSARIETLRAKTRSLLA